MIHQPACITGSAFTDPPTSASFSVHTASRECCEDTQSVVRSMERVHFSKSQHSCSTILSCTDAQLTSQIYGLMQGARSISRTCICASRVVPLHSSSNRTASMCVVTMRHHCSRMLRQGCRLSIGHGALLAVDYKG